MLLFPDSVFILWFTFFWHNDYVWGFISVVCLFFVCSLLVVLILLPFIWLFYETVVFSHISTDISIPISKPMAEKLLCHKTLNLLRIHKEWIYICITVCVCSYFLLYLFLFGINLQDCTEKWTHLFILLLKYMIL